MPRPPHQVGTWGKIRVTLKSEPGEKPERWVAVARFRDTDGKTRPVERQGTTANKAERNLRDELKQRSVATVVVDRSTRFATLAEDYLAWVRANRAATTADGYEGIMRRTVLPALGQLRLHEVTVVRLEQFLADFQKAGASAGTRRVARKVISGVMALAVSYGAIPFNPVKSLRNIEGKRVRKTRALSPAELVDFLTKVDADERAHELDLPDLIWFLFGTGTRLGEAVALRWREVNLTSKVVYVDGQALPPSTVWITGNIVRVKGVGLVRHPGKTDAAVRMIELAPFLRTMLAARQAETAEFGDDMTVFPNQRSRPQDPVKIQSRIRDLRKRVGVLDFTSHFGRKTAITLLAEAGLTARHIADLVGHRDISTTQNVYMGRGRPDPAAAAALQAALRGGDAAEPMVIDGEVDDVDQAS